MSSGGQEGKAHRAADEQHVGDLQEAIDDGDLVSDLCPSKHRDEGVLGMLDDLAQSADLSLEQAPGGAREQVRDALGARVRAVCAAKRVVYVDVSELGQRAREQGIVARLARLEANVLEHEQLAGGE